MTDLREAVDAVLAAVEHVPSGPRSAITPEDLRRSIEGLDICPDAGLPVAEVLEDIGERVLAHGVRPDHPWCVAHLHAPTLATAAAAELAIGATNQSLDSYDQAPAATFLEDHLVRWLGGEVGLPDGRSGVLTAGGTASNLLGLLLAREHADGPGVIVTSAKAHFSVEQAAMVLGLGREAVVPVATDRQGRIDVAALDQTLAGLDRDGRRTVAIVGTAGTTDAGAIDPLPALAARAAARGAWFHVDAAVGGGLVLSDRLRPRLAGLERADSVTVDLHKLCWQPIGASVLLVRDGRSFDMVRQPSDYLDRDDDDVLNLVGRSLDTSRRFDALKVVVSLRSTGRHQMGAWMEQLVDTTAAVAEVIDRDPRFELLTPPSLVMVLFRWRPGDDAANTAIQRQLFARGQAVVGRTRRDGRVALKFTLLNPSTTVDDLARLLDLIAATGQAAHHPAEATA